MVSIISFHWSLENGSVRSPGLVQVKMHTTLTGSTPKILQGGGVDKYSSVAASSY